MIDNIDIAYCMAQLENRIRRENNSAKFTLSVSGFGIA
jgi:hypothetical protein